MQKHESESDHTLSVFDLNQSLRQTILKHDHPLAVIPEFDELHEAKENTAEDRGQTNTKVESAKEKTMQKIRSEDTFGVVIMETECFHLGDISEVEGYEAPKIIQTKVYYLGDVDEVQEMHLPTSRNQKQDEALSCSSNKSTQRSRPKRATHIRHVYRTSGMLMEYSVNQKESDIEKDEESTPNSSSLTVETSSEHSSSTSSLSTPESPIPLSPSSISSEDSSDSSMWNALPVNFFVGTPTTVQTAAQVFYKDQSPAKEHKPQSASKTNSIKKKNLFGVSNTTVICMALLVLSTNAIMRGYFHRICNSDTPGLHYNENDFSLEGEGVCIET